MDAYIACWKNGLDFSGRSRRRDYWMFVLINLLVSIVVGFVPLVNVLYSLAILIPQLALGFRRLHDTGRSGWWLLLPLSGAPFIISGISGDSNQMVMLGAAVCLASGILLFIFSVLDSQPGTNRYGPDPKAAERAGSPAAGGDVL